MTDLVDPAALDAEAVLVDRDDLLVLEDGAVVGLDGAQVDGHEERRSEDGPHRHLRLGLLVAQTEVADDQLRREAKYILRGYTYISYVHGMCTQPNCYFFVLSLRGEPNMRLQKVASHCLGQNAYL